MKERSLQPFSPSPELLRQLRRRLLGGGETISFRREPKVAALVAAIGIHRESGTLNDEMARFLFDAHSGEVVNLRQIRSELVKFREWIGIRIWVEGTPKIDIRVRGLRSLMHPHFSLDGDGDVSQCVFFPELIAKVIASEGVELVLVNRWGMNTIFGGFDPAKHYYQTNFWELENNDTLLFSKLLERRQLPFLGTHDLIAHIAGVRQEAWERIPKLGTKMKNVLSNYFSEVKIPTIASLVLPYTAGVVLDDLAQPPNYDSPTQLRALESLSGAIEERKISAIDPLKLLKFPKGFQATIELARNAKEGSSENIQKQVHALTEEILTHSVRIPTNPAEMGSIAL